MLQIAYFLSTINSCGLYTLAVAELQNAKPRNAGAAKVIRGAKINKLQNELLLKNQNNDKREEASRHQNQIITLNLYSYL